MKRIVIIGIWLAGLALPGFAQEFTKSISNGQQVQVWLNHGDMEIEGYNGNELKITALNYEQPPERAKGLKPLYNSAQDNTGIGLSVTEEEGALRIQEASGRGGKYVIRIPQNARLSVEQLNWNGQDIEVKNMKNEIEIKAKNAGIRLEAVEGPIIANNTSGEISIVYSALKPDAANMISVISSDVDITLPASSKASFQLKSISGEIYTDLDIQLKETEKEGTKMRHLGGGQTIEGTTNGGGTEVNISAISSNIYLRKAQ